MSGAATLPPRSSGVEDPPRNEAGDGISGLAPLVAGPELKLAPSTDDGAKNQAEQNGMTTYMYTHQVQRH